MREGSTATAVAWGRPRRTIVLPIDSYSASLLWLAILPLLGGAAIVFFAAGFGIRDPELPSKLMFYMGAAAIAQIALLRHLCPRLSHMMVGLAQMGAISTMGMLFAYAAATLNTPLVDAQLLAIDQAVGYDWQRYAGFVARHSTFAFVLDHAYMLIFGLPLLAIAPLAYARQFRAIDRYLIATAIALTISIAIFAFCPALTAWDHLGISPEALQPFRHLPNATAGWEHDLLEIRAGRGLVLYNTQGSGLVAFPSFHAGAAVLFAAALWPLRALRIPAAIVATLVMLSAPILGGHYAIDLIAGWVVAAVSLAAAARLENLLYFAASRSSRRRRTA